MGKPKQMNFKKIALAATGTAAGSFVVANTVFKKIDPRIRAIITHGLGLYLIIQNTEDSFGKNFGFGLITAGTIDLINSFRGGMISENKHTKHIWVLMEDAQTLRKIKPYQTIGFFKKIDGIATSFKPGHIFKVPTGCMVEILSNGDIQLSSSVSRLINNKLDEKAGWKNYSFVEKYPSWQSLYEKSLEF